MVSLEVKSELLPADAKLSGKCGILIPAFNEEATVAGIVKTALATAFGPVLVVDDGSSDGTSQKALDAGASVLRLLNNLGKGGAVYEGIRALKTKVVVLIDADLTGLTPHHIVALAKPVLDNKADMTRGIFTGGRWRTTAAQQLTPQLNGQRAILRDKLLSLEHIRESRYGIEILITNAAKHLGWKQMDVPLQDVSQVMKEEKRGIIAGFRYRIGMYRDLIRAMLKR